MYEHIVCMYCSDSFLFAVLGELGGTRRHEGGIASQKHVRVRSRSKAGNAREEFLQSRPEDRPLNGSRVAGASQARCLHCSREED